MSFNRRDFAKVMLGVTGGLLVGACATQNAPAGGSVSRARHECKGLNECKGQGGCKTGDNGCAGKNSCKGHGGCKVS